MAVHSLADFLQANRFRECKEAAESLLRRGALSTVEQAQVYLALSRSLAALNDSQDGLGAAEIAIHLARQTQEYDLLGRACYHLAELCHDNRLYKRALTILDEYYRYFTLYSVAKGLEGRVLHVTALCHQAMGRGAKALEYFGKALAWFLARGEHPHLSEICRAGLTWHLLRMGELNATDKLLAESEAYFRLCPNDLEARARYLNNLAYKACLQGNYPEAISRALRLVDQRGIAPAHKAQACLTLQQATQALGLAREAYGLGLLAKIQASVARRPDIEEEAVRSLLKLRHGEEPPMMEMLAQKLGGLGKLAASTSAQ